MHTAVPLSPEPRAFEFQMAVENLKRQHQVLIKLQQNWLKQEIRQFVLISVRRNCLRSRRNWTSCLKIRRVIK